jgi:hypothetical protein
MKNLLILIVSIATFLHFYPQPKLEEWVMDKSTTLRATFSELTDTKVKLSSKKVYQDIKPHFGQFNQNEQRFITEMTESRKTVTAFFTTHCKGKRPSPKLHQKNQLLVCNTIEQYQALF